MALQKYLVAGSDLLKAESMSPEDASEYELVAVYRAYDVRERIKELTSGRFGRARYTPIGREFTDCVKCGATHEMHRFTDEACPMKPEEV